MLHGSHGVVGHPELEGAQPCPGLPEACPPGGPLVPLVGHSKWTVPSGIASEWLPSESPSAVVWTQQRLARARHGALAASPVFRIQPERRSREVPRGWLNIPPGEGVNPAIIELAPGPMRGRPPLSDGPGPGRVRGTADTVDLEPSGCRQGCPGRLNPASGPASPSCTRGAYAGPLEDGFPSRPNTEAAPPFRKGGGTRRRRAGRGA